MVIVVPLRLTVVGVGKGSLLVVTARPAKAGSVNLNSDGASGLVEMSLMSRVDDPKSASIVLALSAYPNSGIVVEIETVVAPPLFRNPVDGTPKPDPLL